MDSKKITRLSKKEFGDLVRLNSIYGTDGKWIYCGYRRIPEADINTFKVLSAEYAQDKSNIYYSENSTYYILISSFHCKGTKPMGDLDRLSFQVLGKGFAKDKNHVFWKCDIAVGLLPEKVIFLNDNYLKDSSKVYYFYAGHNGSVVGEQKQYLGMEPLVLSGADPDTFQIRGSFYCSDQKTAYWMDSKIPNVDINSFEYLKDDFAKDSKNVYFQSIPIEEADPSSFQFLEFEGYCRDFARVWEYAHQAGEYSACIEIIGADPNTFDPRNFQSHFEFFQYIDE